MGKSKIPLEVLNKKGKLTSKEMEIMKTHTTLGKGILLSTESIEQEVIDVAYAHHERLNSMGYPQGLADDEITHFTKIVSIVDTYDAITSDRVYQRGRLHLDAIKILVNGRKTEFDDHLVLQFVECIGIYPVGNPVEMTNGEVAMVIESNLSDKTKPKVLLLLDEHKKPQKEKLIDLSRAEAIDKKGNAYKLFKVIKQDSYNLNLRLYHEEGTLVRSLGA